MRKLLGMVMVMLLVVPLMAGEYQKESSEYERAFKSGNYTEAITLAKTGVGKGNALNAKGLAALNAGNLNEAKALLEEAIKQDADQYWAHNNLGVVLLAQGDAAGAAKEFQLHIDVNSAATDDGAAGRIAKGKANLATAQLY